MRRWISREIWLHICPFIASIEEEVRCAVYRRAMALPWLVPPPIVPPLEGVVSPVYTVTKSTDHDCVYASVEVRSIEPCLHLEVASSRRWNEG
jgi:hypothetical protein